MRKIVFFFTILFFSQKLFAQLTIYSGYNFAGTSATCIARTIYQGSAIPNGLNNSIKSIQLSQGFMATLAENEDGTGERFTYMATQSTIQVNLALVLQNKISFIRVLKLPNTPVRKKGGGLITNADEIAANITWFYDWGIRDTTTDTREFVPMAWGRGGASDLRVDSVINKDSVTHYLAFNEPDGTSQANLFVSEALPLYKNLLRAGYRMGSPVGKEEGYATWVDSFSTEAAKQKLHYDVICVHWYDWGNWLSTNNANPSATQVLNRFKTYIDNVWNLYKKPIWVTEFNANVNRSAAVNQAFFELALPWMDSDPRIERYAPFFEDHFPLLDANGNLTAMGTMYNAHNSVLAYPQNIVDTRPVYPEVVLAGFNTAALTTTTSNSIANPLAPTTLDNRLTAPQSLTAGSGNTGPFNLAGFWGGLSWSNSTAAVGITENKFISFKLQTNTGKTANYTLIDTVNIRVNTNGPNQYQFQYQINNGSFVNIATRSIATVTALTTAKLNPIDLSGITALQNVPSTSTVTFRLVPYGATTTNSFSIGDGTSNTTNDFAVKGYFLEDTSLLYTTPGNALNFDGINDYVTIPDVNALDLTTNYTLEAWIRPTAFTNSAGIISKSQTNTSTGYYLALSNTSPFTGLAFDGLQTANNILEADKWYHVAAVKEGTTRSLYINGVAVPLTGSAITTTANTQALTLGVHNLQTPKYFTGSIDEVRVWNTARPISSIREFMFNTISPTTNNLVEYYNFDNGAASATNTGLTGLRDLTNAANNGTLTNFSLSGNISNWVESYAMLVPAIKPATNKSINSFTANWDAPQIANLQSVTNYLLDVSTNGNFSSFVSGYNALLVNGTSHDVTGLLPNTTYYYRVRANKISLANQGGFSTTDTVVGLSNNADLITLAISNNGTLSPSFTSSITNYTVSYLNNVTGINFTPTKSHEGAIIQININGGTYVLVNSGSATANLPLNVGNNIINILVTAEDLVTTKTYTINVIREVNTWTGASGSNYNTASNWTGGVVPSINDDVLIPNVSAGSNRYPQVTGANSNDWKSFARNITINAGASLTVTNASDFSRYGILVISGSITNNGTLTVTNRNIIDVNGATIEFAGTAPQTIAANTFAGNSVYNLTINNSSGVTLNGSLLVHGNLTVSNGDFNTNNNLTLSSIATRTARIASSNGTITGNVTIQRFIPAKTSRRWSFVSSPVSQTFAASWQQQIHITGTGTGGTACPTLTPHSNGFDASLTNSPSLFTYNAANSSGLRWVATTSTNATSTTAGTGYRMLIRGPRSSGCALLNGASNVPAAVTLSSTGVINNTAKNMGSFTITYNNNLANNWILVGNPYPSQISFSALRADNAAKINNAYAIYIPSNNAGIYTYWNGSTFTGGSGVDVATGNVLASGSAFFVQSIGASTLHLDFNEAQKTAATASSYQRNNANHKQVRVRYNNADDTQIDEVLIEYININNTTDIESMNSGTNFITSIKDSKGMAVQYRDEKWLKNDEVFLNVVSTVNGTYKLKFGAYEFLQQSATIYLKDNFTGSIINIDSLGNNGYTFITDKNDPKTAGAERFSLLFKEINPDVTTISSIKLFPNPANTILTVQLPNMQFDEMYTIRIIDITGKVQLQQKLANGVQKLNINNLSVGTYVVEVTDNKGKKITEKLVKN